MESEQYVPVAVTRRIEAPAETIFSVLADPRRHVDLDGSEMLRGPVTEDIVTGVGDVFVMKMYYSQIGDYEMNNHVVEYELNRRIGWEPESGRGHPDLELGDPSALRWGQRWTFELAPDGPDATLVTEIYDCSRVREEARVAMGDGRIWIEAMSATLARLDEVCTS